MLPDFDENGNLPPGEYIATLEEITNRFIVPRWKKRRPLTEALQDYLTHIDIDILTRNILRIYIDGSYITSKLVPSDIDMLIVLRSDFDVDNYLWRLRTPERKRQGLDIHVYRENDIGLDRMLTGFKTDRDKKVPKGIVILERKS